MFIYDFRRIANNCLIYCFLKNNKLVNKKILLT